MKKTGIAAITAAAVLLWGGQAAAYIGPGAGLSLIGSVIGLIAAVGTALAFVLFWPFRALWRRLRGRGPAVPGASGNRSGPAAPPPPPPPDPGDRHEEGT